MTSFPLGRTPFKGQATDHRVYYQNLTWLQRVKVANYLTSVAFSYPENAPQFR